MANKTTRRLAIAAAALCAVVLVPLALIYLYDTFRGVRYVAEFTHAGKDDAIVEYDDVAQPVSIYVDDAPTRFELHDISRRILLVLPERKRWPLGMLAVTSHGVGVLGGIPEEMKAFGSKFLVCRPTMRTAHDVRCDMKGLAATMEKRREGGYVEFDVAPYAVVKLQDRQPRKIVVKVRESLYSLVAGVEGAEDAAERKAVEAGGGGA